MSETVNRAAREPVHGGSKEAARLFDDLLAAKPVVRRQFLRELEQPDIAQVLAIAEREGGTPYALWRDDPIGFTEDVLGETTWSKPREILNALPVHKRIAVPSCFGSGKCVYRKEMLTLGDGSLARAEDLVGTEFTMIGWREDGTQTVRRARAEWNRVESVYRVVTETGREAIRNGHHPLYAADNVRTVRSGGTKGTIIRMPSNLGWRPVTDLNVDDLVLVPEEVRPEATERMRFEEAALLGYLLGDGHTGREVRFSHLPGDTLDEFVMCVEALGSVVKDYPVREGRRHRELVVRSAGLRRETGARNLVNPVWDLVKKWGLAGKRATEKSLPEFVWRLRNEDLAVVMSRLFACDGWATHGKTKARPNSSAIGIGLSNEPLIKEVQRAMLRLGVPGRINAKRTKLNGKVYPTWEWIITSARDMRRFCEVMDVPGKNEAMRAALECAERRRHTELWPWRNAPAGYRWEKVKAVERLPDVERTVAIEVDDDHTWVDLFVEHNTWSSARAALHFAYTNPIGTARVVTLAPLWRQVIRQLWPEIRNAHSRAGLPGLVDMAQMKLPDRNGTEHVVAYGLSAPPYQEASVQGIHAPNLLLVVDEAGGIGHVIGRNLRALMVGEGTHMLAIGNPPTDDEGSWFEGLCELESVHTIPIPAAETPNLSGEGAPNCLTCPPEVPDHSLATHLVDAEWVRDTIAEHGDDANYVQAKVYARFPKGGASRIIPAAWIDAAAQVDEPEGREFRRLSSLGLEGEDLEWQVEMGSWVRLGVDVAADGGDEFVIARCVGDLVTVQHRSSGSVNTNAVDVAGRILQEIRRAERLRWALKSKAPVRVKVDGIGVGWGVAGILITWKNEGVHGAEIETVVVSEKTNREPDSATLRPYRKRDEMWLALRSLLQPSPDAPSGRLRLRVPDKALAQLRAPTMGTSATGHTVVEAKKKLKERGLSSPDIGEACILAVYEPGDEPSRKPRAKLIA